MSTRYALMTLSICAILLLVACGGGGGGNPAAVTSAATGVIKGKIAGDGNLGGIPVYLVNVDANIPPVSSIRADVTSSNPVGQLLVTATDQDGAFVFPAVPLGNYNILARRSQTQVAIFRNVSVSADLSTPVDLVLRLTATGDISGTIAVPTGFVKTGVIAFVTGTSYAAYSDANGVFTITGIPIGTYSVVFMATGLQQGKLDNISVGSAQKTTLPLMTLTKDASFIAGITWKGTLGANPANPQVNWAYFNSTDGKAYVFDGTAWQTMAESGSPGPQGTSITWKGTLAGNPSSPSLNWAYYNSTDNKAYIWNGTSWTVLAESLVGPAGPQGPAGTSITWQGTLTAHPSSPQINWAYYNSVDGKSYIWDGSAWQILTQPANNGVVPASIVCGGNFSMVLTSNGFVYNWGSNSRGQMADGTTTNRLLPKPIPGFLGVIQIAAGFEHVSLLKDDFSVWAVGGNQFGQLGDGTFVDRPLPVNITLLNGGDGALPKSSISCGFFQSYRVDSSQTVIGCGNNSKGQLSGVDGPNPFGAGGSIATYISLLMWGYPAKGFSGNEHSGGLVAGFCHIWGGNSKGQCGDGTWSDIISSDITSLHGPVAFTSVVCFSTFYNHNLAGKKDGSVWAWGENTYGQIGDGTTSNRNIPALVSGLTNIVNVAAGGGHSLAIKNDGTVWAWGNNQNGQLGDGTNTNRLTPVQVSGLSDVMAVAAGMNHSLALKSDGTVWAWGDNSCGQLGDGTTVSKNSPVKVQF